VEQKIGHYSFIGGVIIAVVLGLASSALGAQATAWLASLLVVLGLIVGFLNVSGKETRDFMLVAVVLVVAAFAGDASQTLSEVQIIGSYLSGMFSQLLAFIVPATVVVGLKEIWALGQNQ
jgi:ATP synthase protein I